MVDKTLTGEQRERLEAVRTFKRITELELEPVRGNFDAAHLREVNRRIFQDLPALGFDNVKPGIYRTPPSDGMDRQKQRGLSTVRCGFRCLFAHGREGHCPNGKIASSG